MVPGVLVPGGVLAGRGVVWETMAGEVAPVVVVDAGMGRTRRLDM